MINIFKADPSSAEAQRLLSELSKTLSVITGSSGDASFDIQDMYEDGALFVVARNKAGDGIGCGAFRRLDEKTAEVKRMFASPSQGGVGIAILSYLENEAKELGYKRFWLETRWINTRAVQFYTRNGYQRIPNYGKYVGRTNAVCFGKAL